MDQSPIYARMSHKKSNGSKMMAIGIPVAVLAVGALVFATSQPRQEPESTPSVVPASAASPGPAAKPVTTAAATPAPQPAAVQRATPPTRMARVASRPAMAADAASAAQNASAIVTPSAPIPYSQMTGVAPTPPAAIPPTSPAAIDPVPAAVQDPLTVPADVRAAQTPTP